jgi:lactate dehydrogenase-like 2-hydroxyacid dehydrogenase
MALADILMLGRMLPVVEETLASRFTVHKVGRDEVASLDPGLAARIAGVACGAHVPVDAPLIDRLPKLEIVAKGPYPLTAGTLRGRKLGILGLGRIGKAIARRAEAFGMEIHYHGRSRQADVAYPYHPTLAGMAEACDTLMVVAPGGASTRGIVDAGVLKALGPQGIVINVGRGTVIDEPALVAALADGTILSAGLDVFAEEPKVPQALIDMERVVLLPHVGSASRHTRDAMGRLCAENLISWFETGQPVTPVAETPFERKV